LLAGIVHRKRPSRGEHKRSTAIRQFKVQCSRFNVST
jgi:hypothetical protein